MKAITRINHIGLRVTSLTKARTFYEQLGFEFIVGPIGPEPVAIMEHPSGININFILNGSAATAKNILMDVPEKYTGYTHIALEINAIDEILKLLKSKDIKITEGPVTFPGGTSIFIRDQDYNVIEFHKPE
ncbi:MAG: VOC family protein [Rickettsiales bacterium]|jgi:lactoylglutathione lyase|nr:VOC family protein [Rickettsiales bacterium]